MKKLKSLFFIVASIAGLDQLTKGLIVARLPVGTLIPLIPDYLDIVHVRNRGAAFGFLAEQSQGFTVPFFYVSSALALGLLMVYYWTLRENQRLFQRGVACIMGGAVGNLIDRIARGNVVDFVSAHIGDRWADFTLLGHRFVFKLEWPAFNVADSAITLSVIWLLLASIRRPAGRSQAEGSS